MCMFAQPANVSNTRIFAARAKEQGRQFTAYQNVVSTSVKNAMILPAYGKNIVAVDMSNYSHFMSDCEACFPNQRQFLGFGGASFAFGSTSQQPLPVQQVGAYKVTIVPTVDDLWRIDATIFTISRATRDTLVKNYPQEYGFVVCIFSPTTGNMRAHPIGYLSDLLPGDKLFIPTRHEHGDAAPVVGGWTFGVNSVAFDHVIYTGDASASGTGEEQKSTALIHMAWHLLPVAPCKWLQKLTLDGFHPNEDVIVPLTNMAPAPSVVTPPGIVLHAGITCDGCGAKQLRGIRYQCTVCHNYDLCEHCEHLEIHDPTHPLVKHKRPKNTESQWENVL